MGILSDISNLKRVAIAKSDSTVINPPLKAIIVSGIGTLVVEGPDGVQTSIEIPDAAGGAALPFTLVGRVRKVLSTNTDLNDADMIGLI